MKNTVFQLLRSARSSRPLFKKSSDCSVILTRITTIRSLSTISPPKQSITQQNTFEDIDMAPKAPKFELKTPKGTKDCKIKVSRHDVTRLMHL